MTETTFTERHAEKISRLKLVLIVVCLIAIPVTFWINHSDFGSVNERVTKVESPCLRYGPSSPQCRTAFEQAVRTISHAEACAILRKAGLRITECVHAHLSPQRAAKGVVPSTGNSPHSQPGPQRGGSPVSQQPAGGHEKSPPHGHSTQPSAPSTPEPTSLAPPSQPQAPQASTQPEEHSLPAPPVTAPVEPPAKQPPGLLEEVTHGVGAPLCSVTEAVLHLCS